MPAEQPDPTRRTGRPVAPAVAGALPELAPVTGEHRQPYHLRHDELGPGGCFAPSVLLGVLQEAAIDGSAARGFPFDYYRRERAFWVLRSITCRLERPLRFGDSLEVATWVSRVGKTSPTREYRMTSATRGATIARVRTHWVYVDAMTGLPKPIPDDLRAGFAPTEEEQEPLTAVVERPLDPARTLWTETRIVQPTDVDRAGHMKCCRYLAWIEDLLVHATATAGAPVGSIGLGSYELQLLLPAQHGDRVRLVAQLDAVCKIEMTTPDGRVLARAVAWPVGLDAARTAFLPLEPALLARLQKRPARDAAPHDLPGL
jgi:acyl-CoA thioesterase FadM